MLAKRVAIFTYEGDRFARDLVQRKLVTVLKDAGAEVATVVPTIAGYTKQRGITTRSLVEAGGQLPLMVEFIASPNQLERLLPTIRTMVGERTITITDVEVDSSIHAL